MRASLLTAALLFGVFLTLAPSQTRDLFEVQKRLQTEGFYIGEPDGKPGPETNAALRRFQLHRGLSATGSLDEETERELFTTEAEPVIRSGTAREATPSVQERRSEDQDFLRQDDSSAPMPPPTVRGEPTQPPQSSRPIPPLREQAVPPQQPLREEAVPLQPGQAYRGRVVTPEEWAGLENEPHRDSQLDRDSSRGPDSLDALLSGGPFQGAPEPVRRDILIHAQMRLQDLGFYRPDLSQPFEPNFSHALRVFQRRLRLPETGTLNGPTLAELGLLGPPVSGPYYPY
ncbi:MAG: peptidoglycan-binding protein [Verrucomicrobiales bacterium]